MNSRSRLFAIGIAWLCLFAAADKPVVCAQPDTLKFERLSLEQGLSSTIVRCVIQDRRGFLWFGTEYGLNRYDGYSIVVYSHKPYLPSSLSNNYVDALFEDRNGLLWVGTGGGGLNRFDPVRGEFTIYKHDPNDPYSLGNNYVKAIIEDASGVFWIGTDDGLNRFDPREGRFTAYRNHPNAPASLSHNYVKAVYEDRSGNLWIGTDGGLNRLDRRTGQFTVFRNDPKNPRSLSHNYVKAVYEDRSGNLWIGTDGGLNRFDRQSGEFTVPRHNPDDPNGPRHDIVRAIFQDRQGTLWVGTDGGGLQALDPERGTFRTYRNDPADPQSLGTDQITSIFEDASGTLWVATYGGGVNRRDLARQRFTTVRRTPDNPKKLSNNNVLSILEDRTGTLWVGTQDGLNRLDANRPDAVVHRNDPRDPASLSGNRVNALCEDSEGVIWIGTDGGGLNRFNPARGGFTAFRNDPNDLGSLSLDRVNTIFEDRSKTLWIGTYGGGLNAFDRKRFTAHRNRPDDATSLSNNVVNAVYEDRSGTLWIGTAGGLNRFDPRTRSFIVHRHAANDPRSLSNDVVNCILEDADGTLWIATAGGLNKMDRASGTFTSYTEREGLLNNALFGILPDADGNLWVSSNLGVSRFSPKTGTFKNFDVGDGLQGKFNKGSFLRNKSGELFFGGTNGLNRFRPESIQDNPYIPPVVLTELTVSGNPFPQAAELLAQASGELPKTPVELSYRNNFFSVEFAALNFRQPERNRYAYKLEGVDQDWVFCGTRREANYTNIAPGSYVFRVKGSNNDGVWNERGAAVRITILPPPWKTWWAYALYGLAACGVLYGGFRFQANKIRMQARLLEMRLKAEAAEGLAEAARAKVEAAELQAQAAKVQAEAAEALALRNEELARINAELAAKNDELSASHAQADRIFSALAETLPGTVLDGKYRLDEKIGSGGFGVVFRATHLMLNRPIAVKVFRPAPGNDSPDAVKRFRLEGISATRINHPNAIVVLDSGISINGVPYLVMELLEGRSLADELRDTGRLSLRRCLEILTPLCSALSEAHRSGIIHRDIKPDNIFLHRGFDGKETLKVLDFGVAKLIGEISGESFTDLTRTGGILGTPSYMAPERLAGRSYDGRADVYSLGVVLYEMLCGRTPFRITEKGIVDVILRQLSRVPTPLRKHVPDIPESVENVVLSALAKDPARRPTAAEFGHMFAEAVLPYLDTGPLAHFDPQTEPDTEEDIQTLCGRIPRDMLESDERPVEPVKTIEN